MSFLYSTKCLKFLGVIVFLQTCLTNRSAGQDFYSISLAEFRIESKSNYFTVTELIDARSDKATIGLVQKGIGNRKVFAAFDKPFLQEIQDLLHRSARQSEDNPESYVVRITRLNISEQTLALSETARAEISIDFFIKDQSGRYAYITSVVASAESSGMDVTSQHAGNIVKAFEKAFAQFSGHTSAAPQYNEMFFLKDDLENARLSFRDFDSMPVLTATKYPDGFYASFDEFANNAPSIDINCQVKLGDKIKIKCTDEDGTKSERYTDVFGFAKDNKLFVMFHKHFYPLEKSKDTFFFTGPRFPGQMSEYAKGWLIAGALGGAIASSSSSYQAIYKIDLATGSMKSVTGIH